jgi:hypothetical protein
MSKIPYPLPRPQASPPNQGSTGHASRAEPCRYCGVMDRPTLSAGTGPHACKATCAHCGRFLRWISLVAPSERLARRAKARLKAMQARPASEMQLAYLRSLGDRRGAPATMAEASTRIDRLLQERQGA